MPSHPHDFTRSRNARKAATTERLLASTNIQRSAGFTDVSYEGVRPDWQKPQSGWRAMRIPMIWSRTGR